jgi:hypothetical protein
MLKIWRWSDFFLFAEVKTGHVFGLKILKHGMFFFSLNINKDFVPGASGSHLWS